MHIIGPTTATTTAAATAAAAAAAAAAVRRPESIVCGRLTASVWCGYLSVSAPAAPLCRQTRPVCGQSELGQLIGASLILVRPCAVLLSSVCSLSGRGDVSFAGHYVRRLGARLMFLMQRFFFLSCIALTDDFKAKWQNILITQHKWRRLQSMKHLFLNLVARYR